MSLAAPDGEYPYLAMAFGLRWRSQVALTAFHELDGAKGLPGEAEISVRLTGQAARRELTAAAGQVQFAPDGFRYLAGEVATLDGYGASEIEVCPGPAWSGQAPVALFSTVTALLLAGRGLIPIHGSAVEQDGRATLICGAAGTGKSTTAARRIAGGARLISDDLTMLHPDPHGGAPMVYAGRRTMRLFESTAAALGREIAWQAPPRPAEGKMAVDPPQVEPGMAVPLERVVVLGHPAGPVAAGDRAAMLAAQLFRPAKMRRLPGHPLRLAKLAMAARQIRLEGASCL